MLISSQFRCSLEFSSEKYFFCPHENFQFRLMFCGNDRRRNKIFLVYSEVRIQDIIQAFHQYYLKTIQIRQFSTNIYYIGRFMNFSYRLDQVIISTAKKVNAKAEHNLKEALKFVKKFIKFRRTSS